MSRPHAVGALDLETLRHMGWTDSDLIDAVAHGARNTAVDILFNTFKIERDFSCGDAYLPKSRWDARP